VCFYFYITEKGGMPRIYAVPLDFLPLTGMSFYKEPCFTSETRAEDKMKFSDIQGKYDIVVAGGGITGAGQTHKNVEDYGHN